MTKKDNSKRSLSFLTAAAPSLIAVLIGLVVGVIIIVVTNPEVGFSAIPTFFKGPFNSGLTGFGDLFYHITPLLMTGLSVGFAYQTGLFNIGAAGQFLLGGFLAILVSAKLQDVVPASLLWVIAFLVAGLGGALIASIVGVLKAYRNVNEVITCIMLNYTTMYAVNYFIKKFGIYNQMKNNTIDIKTSIPKMGLDTLFPGTISGGGIILGIIFVVITHIILNKTTFGFELKGVGLNRHAARYAGVNENKSIVLSMAIAGMLAAFGGAMVYLSGAGNHLTVQEVLPPEGFDGIAIALLGLNAPIGIFFSAALIAFLKMGGQAIQTLGYAPELITMIISFILYVSALSVLFRRLLSKKIKTDLKQNINSEPVLDVGPRLDVTDSDKERGEKL